MMILWWWLIFAGFVASVPIGVWVGERLDRTDMEAYDDEVRLDNEGGYR